MPPRKKKEETPVTAVAEAPAPVVDETNAEEGKRAYDKSPVALLSEFEVVESSEVPRVTRDRERNNPFDQAVQHTWNEAFYLVEPEPRLLRVKVENVKRAIRQLTSAGDNIGVGVTAIVETENETADRDYEGTGTVWFYARPKKERKTKTDESGE